MFVPTGGLEPPIFGLGDRRLIHWATRALLGDDPAKTTQIFQSSSNFKFMFKKMAEEISTSLKLELFDIYSKPGFLGFPVAQTVGVATHGAKNFNKDDFPT